MTAMPNFFLVGAPKAGTTALYNYLYEHPQIYMSPIKEPHFLADEIRYENFTPEMQQMSAASLAALEEYLKGPACERFSGGPVSRWEDYLKLFDCASDEKAIGEASPCYLWSPTAARNIASRFPAAKIIMILRNPVERAFSQYKHMLMFANGPVSFMEHIELGLQSKSTRIGQLYPFLGFGLYYEQVKRYLELFPRDRIRIYFYEDFCSGAPAVVADIFDLLSVDRNFRPDLSKRYMEALVPRSYSVNAILKRSRAWSLVSKRISPRTRAVLRKAVFRPREALVLEPAARARLIEYYSEDVRNLSELLKRNLTTWLR